jgi:hypothetical protein
MTVSLLVLTGCAAAVQLPPEPPPAREIGIARVGLLGDYAGRSLRLEVEGRVLVEQRLPFPPLGAEDRYEVEIGPARSVSARLTIEGCDQDWSGDIEIAPGRTTRLLIQGCEVRAFEPE